MSVLTKKTKKIVPFSYKVNRIKRADFEVLFKDTRNHTGTSWSMRDEIHYLMYEMHAFLHLKKNQPEFDLENVIHGYISGLKKREKVVVNGEWPNYYHGDPWDPEFLERFALAVLKARPEITYLSEQYPMGRFNIVFHSIWKRSILYPYLNLPKEEVAA